ncbi:Vacuolar protein sorting-associated protein 16 [Candida viswanathii]|uniref:Probable vacuolar protein sorting-associated protein 16 homolog n=1 Tax=Candida viswanathii TaxID=5486 RepID=A0A367XPY5_9ASCO|nr:Vacuolar protein sorting-associated protein 16 [Candida viswanathii]
MPPNPSFNWLKLQNVYYNIRTCYEDLNWSIDNLYSNYVVSFSPNTTLIAIASRNVPHPNLIEIYSNSGNKIWSIVYNSTHDDYIQSFHFTSDEDLIIIMNNGKYRHYYDLMGNFNEHNFLENLTKMDNLNTNDDNSQMDSGFNGSRVITNLENNETEEIIEILEVKTWENYLVVRLQTRLIVTNLNTFVNYEVALKNYKSTDFTSFSAQTNPNLDKTEEAIVLQLGYKSSVLSINIDFGLTNFEVIDQELTDGPFSSIAISPGGQLISLFNKQLKKIFVINNRFDQVLLEYDTSNESSTPYQVEWCGNDAIVLSIKDEIKLIGPGQQSISFFYDIEDDDDFDLDNLLVKVDSRERDLKKNDDLLFTIPIFQSCVDGLKIVTTNKVQFLSRVPETSVQMYQIGSSSPSSILVDCVDKFSSNASKAHGNISLLKADETLLTAMNDCLEVALDEFAPEWQRRALQAVSFGKIYYDDLFDADKYLLVVNTIKVLNQIRSPELGLFLTYRQIEYMGGWEQVIKMLLRRNQHELSLEFIDKLKLENVRPLVHIHWCCYKIRKKLDMLDLELFKIISERLTSLTKDRVNYISVGTISDIAYEEGRNVLCKLLIDLEPSVTKKINQLLDIDEALLALIKSFESGNHDLSVLILLYLQDKLTTSQFFKILNQNENVWKEDAVNKETLAKLDINLSRTENMTVTGDIIGHTWQESIGKTSSPQLLETYLKHEDKVNELNLQKLKSFHKDNTLKGDQYYDAYKSLLTKSTNRTLNKRTSKALSRELQILDLQKKLSETYLTDFYQEKSLIAILTRMITMNQIKPAKKIVSNFQISQEKFWYLVLNTLMKRKEFDQVYEFAFGSNDATVGKSPIGFEPFVELGFQTLAPPSHISTYIKNSVKYKYDEKVRMYVKNQDYEAAALEAFKNKDIDILRSLQLSIPSSDSLGTRAINTYIQKLGY